MEEIWKDIKGYEGWYQVSNFGRIKSLERVFIRKNGTPFFVRERILKYAFDHGGYPYVTLIKFKKRHNKAVHRIVAETFIPNPENKPCIDHIDCNPKNPMANNLRWVTVRENVLNPITVQRRMSGNSPIGKGLNAKPVMGKSIVGDDVLYFDKVKDVATKGFDPSAVSACALGKTQKHKGYTWRFTSTDNKLSKNSSNI